MPVTKDRKQPTAKLRFFSARRSTTGRAKVRLRTTNRTPVMLRSTHNSGSSASSNQFQREPSSSTYSSVPRPTAISAMPG